MATGSLASPRSYDARRNSSCNSQRRVDWPERMLTWFCIMIGAVGIRHTFARFQVLARQPSSRDLPGARVNAALGVVLTVSAFSLAYAVRNVL